MFSNLRQSSPFDGIRIDDRNERPLTVALCDDPRGLVPRFRAHLRLGSHRRELRVLAHRRSAVTSSTANDGLIPRTADRTR